MMTRALLLLALAAIAAPLCSAAELTVTPAQPSIAPDKSGGVIPADTAMAFTSFIEADGHIVLSWEMAPNVYLYRKSLSATTADGTVLELELPEGTVVSDEFFGESEVYFGRLLARIPIAALDAEPGATVELPVSFQGCLKDVYCYPPQHKLATLLLP